MSGDFSLSAHDLTYFGDPVVDGEELVFDGTDDYVQAADHANWQFSGDFTIELFGVKFDGVAGTPVLISHYNATTNNRGWLFQFRGDLSPKRFSFALSTAGTSGTTSNVEANYTPVAGTAYDLCVERSGSTVRIYVDGAMVNSGTLSGTSFNSTAGLIVGAAGNLANFHDGRMKGWRITKGTARYATDSSYSVPTLPLATS